MDNEPKYPCIKLLELIEVPYLPLSNPGKLVTTTCLTLLIRWILNVFIWDASVEEVTSTKSGLVFKQVNLACSPDSVLSVKSFQYFSAVPKLPPCKWAWKLLSS